MKKNIVSVFFSICLLLASINTFSFAAEADSYSNRPIWSDIYFDFVLYDDYLDYGTVYIDGVLSEERNINTITFALHDMDRNGIPELLVSNGTVSNAGSTHHVFTIEQNKIIYLGKAGSRSGQFIIPTSKAYPGLYWFNGNMGYYGGSYYYLQDGVLKNEEVLLEESYYEEYKESTKITQITDDYNLFVACKDSSVMLDEFLKAEINAVGWDAFVSHYYDSKTKSYDVSFKYYNSIIQWIDTVPFIDENGRTMVPLRTLGELLGLTVNWDDASKTASFSNEQKTIYFTIGSNISYTSTGEMIQMDTIPVIIESRTYAPVRYLAEFFGYSVEWNAITRTITIG